MKYLWLTLVVLFVAVLLSVVYLKLMLPNTGGAPDLQVEITPERVERGKYLAHNVMVCADCHSMRDYSKFSAPITGHAFSGGGDEFTEEFGLPGNFYASNLTPFYLKDWTDGELFRAITTGVSKNGRALFPAMPYPLYNHASEEDIHAVIAYLRTLPSVDNTVKESKAKFPVNMLINTMPVKYNYPVKPDEQNVTEYGKYMATIAGCIECHTPMVKGKPVWEEAFSGGRDFLLPGGVLTTSNLTPDATTGIGNWTEEMFISRFKAFADSSYLPHDVDINKEFNTLMPWMLYSQMNETDLKAIYAYLRTLEPKEKQITLFTPRN
jgi:mono/diheme cytochrome c family protein